MGNMSARGPGYPCRPARGASAAAGGAPRQEADRISPEMEEPGRPEGAPPGLGASMCRSGGNGGRYWTRTSDPCDVNTVLYQLS